MMATVNGKLIREEHNKLDRVTEKVDNLTQTLKKLELQINMLNKQQKTEYCQQINGLKQSLIKIERLYQKLLIAILVSTMGLGGAFLWLDSNPLFFKKLTQEQVLPGK